MRKIICAIACACMCACASSPKPVARTTFPVDSLDSRPPTDFEMTVANGRTVKTVQPTMPDADQGEQTRYEASVERIEKKFESEYLQLQMCDAVNDKDKKPCAVLLANFCAINMFLDSRGEHHVKPYCAMVKRQGY